MRVPFVDLKSWVAKVRAVDNHVPVGLRDVMCDFKDRVATLLDSREFIGGGPTTQQLEATLALKLDVPHVVTCANGTDALMLALRAHGIGPGVLVAISNMTFWATYEAIVNVGATPVVLDIDPHDLQLSFDEFARYQKQHRFNAAVLPHLYGWCSARLNDFRTMCREKHILLIEDGAQAYGVKVDDKSIFAGADCATLSFHPAKVLGGIGDGGAVLCRSARVAARVRHLANHGRIDHYNHVSVGMNSRLDAIQAAWLLSALEVVDDVIAERRRLSRDLGYADWTPKGVDGNGYLDVALSNDRDEERKRLRRLGIDTGCVYPTTIADQDGAHGCIQLGPLNVSRDLAEKVYNRPLFYGMTDEQVEIVREATG